MRGWEVGFWAGVFYYFGDLNINYCFDWFNVVGGILVCYNFNEWLLFFLSGNYGKIEVYDSDLCNVFECNCNFSFELDIWDVLVFFEFNFFFYFYGSCDYFFMLYFFGGLFLFNFNFMVEYMGIILLDGVQFGEMVELCLFGIEGQFKGEEYYIVIVVLIYGIGFKWDLNYDWSMNFYIGVCFIYIDYLDDVSGFYFDLLDLEKDCGLLVVYMFFGMVLDDDGGSVQGLNGCQ